MKSGIHYSEKYKNMYMQVAEAHASLSTSDRLKVGCVIVLNDLSMFGGFNGMPSGSDSEICEDSQGKTKDCVIHSEINAINRVRNSMEVFYTDSSVIFITHSPCLPCATELQKFGIVTVYYREEYRCKSGINYLMDNGIKVIKMDDKNG